jgi:Ca-activated chloride channel family protein
MSFDYPFIFFAFLVYIPLIFLDIFAHKYKDKLAPELKRRYKASVYLFRLFFALAIIAMAGPRWGTGFAVSEYRRGLDAVFAIDVSRSMDVRDAQSGGSQSRLERGLSIAEDAAASVTGARFAAAIGRGRGYLTVPLTWDNEAALSFFKAIDASSMTGRSTNLEALLDAAADAFRESSPAKKVIILFSDGETVDGLVKNALNRCVKEGIVVNAVALGSDDGRAIAADPLAPQAGDVLSRRDAALMRMIAERTGGIYIDGSRLDAASALSSHLVSIAQEMNPGSGRPEPKERRTMFIILAIIAFAASKFVPMLPERRSSSLARTAVSLIAALFIFNSCSEGKLLLVEANYLHSRGRYDEALIPYLKALNYEDSAPYAEYGLGLTFYLIDEGEAALKRYDSSQKKLDSFSSLGEHRELRYRNNYNSGIVYFEDGNFSAAAAAFKNALREDPRKIDAKRNLELSLMSIERQTGEDKESEKSEEYETKEILFEYIKQDEQQKWKSREWAPDERVTGPDY